jgi:radical SAM superfamily enzyme YgiQ (UPF0313 family)
MKILILDPYPNCNYRISKDTSGGYGTANDFGNSLVSKILKKKFKQNSNWPPLFSAYTFSVLKKNGHDVKYSQNIPSNMDGFKIIIIVSSIVSYETEIDKITKIKKNYPDIKIFVIGPFATNNTNLYLKYNVSVITGEPEFFFLNNKNLDEFFDKDLINSDQNLSKLEDLPYPDWVGMGYNLKKINNLFGKHLSVPILGTRGCPFSCFKYCVYPLQQGRKIRQREPADIVNEIKYFNQKYGVTMFIFRDPVFSINRKHTMEFCNELKKQNIKIKFIIETHLKILDSNLIIELKKVGLKAAKVGIESSDESVLQSADRYSESKDQQLAKIKELHQNNIAVSAMYIIGFPEDDEKSVLTTINYSIKLNTAYAQFSVWTPYPGTPIYKNYSEKIVTNKYENFTQYQLVYTHKKFSKDKIRSLLEKAYSKYYLRINWLIRFIKQIYF